MARVRSFNSTRMPPRIPCEITPVSAKKPKIRSHRGWAVFHSTMHSAIVNIPTAEANNRCPCSMNKFHGPKIHVCHGYKNRLYP